MHVCIILYYLALAGGPVGFIMANLKKFGFYALVSSLSFSTAFVISSMIVSHRVRLITQCSMVGCMLALFAFDHGADFQAHGQYNALFFTIAVVVLLSISLSLMFCYNRATRKATFWRTLAVAAVVVTLLVAWRLVHSQQIWGRGLLNKEMKYPSGACSFAWAGNWPWIDLFPSGIQTFWTGSQTCPLQAFHIDANITDTGVLTIECPQGEPAYTIMPDTRLWSTTDKMNTVLFQNVESHKSPRTPYTGPVHLSRSVEAILVHCGTVTELRFFLQVAERFSESLAATPAAPRPLNVLLVFMDAVGRRHAVRRLPHTMRTLEALHRPDVDIGHRLSQFFRYHTVAFNTNGNTRAMFTGSADSKPSQITLFEEAANTSYALMRAETNCDDWGSQYLRRTVSESYDHELIAPFCDGSYYPHQGSPFGNFKGPYSILRRCLWDRYVHRHTFDYLSQASEVYAKHAPNVPLFMTASLIEGHEGSGEVLGVVDLDLARFITKLHERGTLKDTAVFIVADHGLHMGLNFVYAQNGLIEQANPVLFSLIPNRFLTAEMAENLEHNEQTLMTGAHLYHMWRDVLGLSVQHPELSLLRTKLPLEGTCAERLIGPTYCQCK